MSSETCPLHRIIMHRELQKHLKGSSHENITYPGLPSAPKAWLLAFLHAIPDFRDALEFQDNRTICGFKWLVPLLRSGPNIEKRKRVDGVYPWIFETVMKLGNASVYFRSLVGI